MGFENIKTACVIDYPYLWKREDRRGETEGRKDRPVAVATRAKTKDGDFILLLPITSKSPDADTTAIEIPETEKKRASLDTAKRLWIVISEYNFDEVGESYYLEPKEPRGRFGFAFFQTVVTQFKADLPNVQSVKRT